MYASPMRTALDLFCSVDVVYEAALGWQRARAAEVREGAREVLALIEHRPVYTMGRRGGRESMRLGADAMPAPVVDIERGGDMTWHGPGQLVGYPILDLRSRGLRPADYVRLIEGVVIDALDSFDIDATTVRGRPGVWVAGAKVAAIGVAIRGGISMHGFALNVSCDVKWFDAIVPCGIADATVTSVAQLLPAPPSMAVVRDAVQGAFEQRFEVSLVAAGPLPALAGATA